MPNISDAKFAALRALGHTGAISDMVLQWLQSQGATSVCMSDAWKEYLIVVLPTNEPENYQRNDWWYEYLGTQGHEGAMNDRELSFWLSFLP